MTSDSRGKGGERREKGREEGVGLQRRENGGEEGEEEERGRRKEEVGGRGMIMVATPYTYMP